MKVSELIQWLERVRLQHGDINVVVHGKAPGTGEYVEYLPSPIVDDRGTAVKVVF